MKWSEKLAHVHIEALDGATKIDDVKARTARFLEKLVKRTIQR